MSCGGVYVADHGDGAAEIYNARIQKARKDHVCYECRKKIQPGDQYEYVTALWEGGFSAVKTCSDCLAVREKFFCDGFEHGGIWSHLTDHIDECGGDIDVDRLADLPKTARDKVCDLIERYWSEV